MYSCWEVLSMFYSHLCRVKRFQWHLHIHQVYNLSRFHSDKQIQYHSSGMSNYLSNLYNLKSNFHMQDKTIPLRNNTEDSLHNMYNLKSNILQCMTCNFPPLSNMFDTDSHNRQRTAHYIHTFLLNTHKHKLHSPLQYPKSKLCSFVFILHMLNIKQNIKHIHYWLSLLQWQRKGSLKHINHYRNKIH